jgi:small subunit ribosomal protein S17
MMIMDQKKEDIAARGRKFTGKVSSAKMSRTVIIVLERRIYNTKYERYHKRSTRIKAHVPAGMEVTEGDTVSVQETRPISKTKHFIITKIHPQGSSPENDNVQKEEAGTKKSAKQA